MLNENSPSYALVTGAAGLVGTELVRQLLQKGLHVRALVHHIPLSLPSHPLLQIVKGDLLDVVELESLLQNVNRVYHSAGLISYIPKKRNSLYQINVEATANLVNACLDKQHIKFIHVSSIASLGKYTEGKLLNENSKWKNDASNSNYGYSKYLGEMEVWRGAAEGLDAVIVNPSIILGAGDWNSGSTAIFKKMYDEFPWYSEGINGFVDVKDLAEIMIRLGDSNISNERYIVSAENKSYRDVFCMIADAFGKKRPNKNFSRGLSQIAWRLEALRSLFTGKDPLITRETSNSALIKVEYDNSKLLKAIPDFTYTPLQESIKFICSELQQKVNIH
jgi:nucleoside-diphosphate-sugar epimerase